jgi:hypothetical protein
LLEVKACVLVDGLELHLHVGFLSHELGARIVCYICLLFWNVKFVDLLKILIEFSFKFINFRNVFIDLGGHAAQIQEGR